MSSIFNEKRQKQSCLFTNYRVLKQFKRHVSADLDDSLRYIGLPCRQPRIGLPRSRPPHVDKETSFSV